MDGTLNLDGKIFVVEKNDGEDAQLPPGSTFEFRQVNGEITATYSGGRIKKGTLKGVLRGHHLHHRYTQVLEHERLFTGRAVVEIRERQDGRLEILDAWAWKSPKEENGICLMVERPS